MNRSTTLSGAAVAAISALITATAAEAPHWGYSGANGPQNWASLSPTYSTCGSGKSQSPINIANAHDAELPPLDFKYSTYALDFTNNGHAVQTNYAAGSTLADQSRHVPAKASASPPSTVGHLGSTFELKQFHFHSPSEHQLNGKNMPAEIHFVHADKQGNLAVIGVFVTEGAAHPTISQLWQQLPTKAGEDNKLTGSINASTLLPAKHGYDYYQGSLTTPPCSEGVRWLVMKDPITMSAEQLASLKKAIGFANNRPVQPLNGRVVFN